MVDIVGRAILKVESALDTSQLNSQGKKAGAIFAKGALVGVAALGSLAAYSVKAGLAAEEAAKKQRVFAAVLDNMGKSQAAPRLAELAAQLGKVAGIDDEVIKGGQTILASFKSIAASADVVGGTFDRATKAAVDLASTPFFNGNVEGASKALGKALNDPLKGITALTRAGVPFSAAQKEQIKDFIASNDLASAQALILGEVETKFGGLAEASATGSERFKTSLGELQEAFGFLLADLFGQEGKKSFIDQAADAVFVLTGKIEEFQESDAWTNLKSDMREFGGDLKTVAGAIKTIGSNIDGLLQTISGDEKKGLLYWLNKVGAQLNPIQRIAEAIEAVGDAIDAVNGKNGSILGGPLDSLFGLNGQAGGGRSRGGLTLVGERGPELVNMPTGANVTNAANTRAILGSGGGDTYVYAPVVNGPTTGSALIREWDWANRFKSQYGGRVSGVSA